MAVGTKNLLSISYNIFLENEILIDIYLSGRVANYIWNLHKTFVLLRLPR